MKSARLLPGLMLLTLLTPTASLAGGQSKSSSRSVDISAYLGRWDLTLKSPDREYASWLEITQPNGVVRARMVSRWGHARWLPTAELVNSQIKFVSPKEEEAAEADMIFEGGLSGQLLVGNANGPDGAVWTWRGERAPALEPARSPQWGPPVALFNGRDLSGWRPSDSHANTWEVNDGTLVSPGKGSDLLTDKTFEDFKLHIEFNCAPNANSGVYLRGRYEVQIEDDTEPPVPDQSTGGIYGFLAPSTQLAHQPGQWHAFDITLVGRYVTVALDGQTIIDNQEIPGITGGALDSHEALPGPIYLQGSEPGRVAFRNIVVTPARGSR
jgi:hypothetical protein